MNNSSKNTFFTQSDFMHLTLAERQQIMAKQANQMLAHYQHSEDERNVWQAAEFIFSI